MFTPLTLPNGSRLTNRLAKAAMEENLAAPGQLPGPALWRLYRYWAEGGAGLIITGNVMIDGRAMTGPGGVVLEQDTPLAPFETWAKAARQGGAQWMQLNHPGRQVMANMGGNAWRPPPSRWRWASTASCSPSRRRWIKRRSPRLSRASPPARTPPNGPVLPA